MVSDINLDVSKVSVTEEYFDVSDGVALRLIDFKPDHDTDDHPMVLFVAGWVSLPAGWEGLLTGLTPHYRLIYIETREKKSAVLPTVKRLDFSISRMVNDIQEILQVKVNKRRPIFFSGSSLGSTIILDYLSRTDTRKPRASILISPICEFPFPAWLLFVINFVPAFFYTLVRPVMKWYLKYFRLDRKNEPEQVKKYEGTIDAAEPGRLKANAFAIKNYSLWKKLHKVDSSVIIIGAETDSLHGTETLKKIIDLMPSATLKLMQSNKETHSDNAGRFIADQIDIITASVREKPSESDNH